MKTSICTLGVLSLAAFFTGCHTTPGPFPPQDTTRCTLENTKTFVLLDRTVQHEITCTGLQEHMLPDGRYEVVANVKNREKHRIEVQIDCVFKNEQGTATEEVPYQSLILAEYETRPVTFTSMNDQARRYTIRVRHVR